MLGLPKYLQTLFIKWRGNQSVVIFLIHLDLTSFILKVQLL